MNCLVGKRLLENQLVPAVGRHSSFSFTFPSSEESQVLILFWKNAVHKLCLEPGTFSTNALTTQPQCLSCV